MYFPAPTPSSPIEFTDFFGSPCPVTTEFELFLDVIAGDQKLMVVIRVIRPGAETLTLPFKVNETLLRNTLKFPNIDELAQRLEKYKLEALIIAKSMP